MTLGRSDSDNLIRDNNIKKSGEPGICFRGGGKAFAALAGAPAGAV